MIVIVSQSGIVFSIYDLICGVEKKIADSIEDKVFSKLSMQSSSKDRGGK
ncbi:MAG TPA: hypothetical protein VE619_03015 [Nitrososphaeraceae archaeon]|nr:hypothetical protein [Nitrososphaeraceae archaeon]